MWSAAGKLRHCDGRDAAGVRVSGSATAVWRTDAAVQSDQTSLRRTVQREISRTGCRETVATSTSHLTFFIHSFIFAARCYASAAYVVMRCLSVCLSVCLSRSRSDEDILNGRVHILKLGVQKCERCHLAVWTPAFRHHYWPQFVLFCINCIIVFLGRMLVLFISLFVLALVVLTYIAQLYVLCLSWKWNENEV